MTLPDQETRMLMAQPESLDLSHRAADARIIATREAVESMRWGGTARDVRDAIIDRGGDLCCVRTTARDLWLLHRLGLVSVEVRTSGDGAQFHWWTAAKASAAGDSCARAVPA